MVKIAIMSVKTKFKKSPKNLTPNTQNTPIKVVTVPGKGGKVNRSHSYEIENFGTLGREIKISPKANVTVNKPGYKTEFFIPTITLLIGIGRDHTADLIMPVDAWEALKAGKEIKITTTKEFKEKFL